MDVNIIYIVAGLVAMMFVSKLIYYFVSVSFGCNHAALASDTSAGRKGSGVLGVYAATTQIEKYHAAKTGPSISD